MVGRHWLPALFLVSKNRPFNFGNDWYIAKV
jgi:hypothetical protein